MMLFGAKLEPPSSLFGAPLKLWNGSTGSFLLWHGHTPRGAMVGLSVSTAEWASAVEPWSISVQWQNDPTSTVVCFTGITPRDAERKVSDWLSNRSGELGHV